MFKIMDVTLRDGSYANHFQFTLAQQKAITMALEDLGYEYIEIGHGMGLGASSPKNGVALHTDEEYLETAQTSLYRAKYGAFCIPGIASLEHVDMAQRYGAGFLRFGTNVTEVENSEPYIYRAKEKGIMAMANLMKAYAVEPNVLAEQVRKAEEYGADYVYIVDSAGCMLPSDIRRCYESIREVTDVKLGFHGHDNLGMALWNSFTAVELGFDLIDCTLQGMGRSSGNAPIEMMTICARKMGYDMDVDILKLLNISKKYIYPLISRFNNIDIMCGVVGMHTGYLGAIHKMSGKYGISPMMLMEEYSKVNKVSMNSEKLEQIAKRLPSDSESLTIADFNGYFGQGQY